MSVSTRYRMQREEGEFMAILIADKFEAWKAEANARFDQLGSK